MRMQWSRSGCKYCKFIKEFEAVFSDQIGDAIHFEIDLKLKDNRPYSSEILVISAHSSQKWNLRKELNLLLQQNIIKPSLSNWISPSFLGKKGNTDEYRLVVNYDELNKQLEPVSWTYSTPKGLYFTVLNLRQ